MFARGFPGVLDCSEGGRMTREDLEYWHAERAAILHFDGGWPKEKAEALAKAEMESHWNAVVKAREAQA